MFSNLFLFTILAVSVLTSLRTYKLKRSHLYAVEVKVSNLVAHYFLF